MREEVYLRPETVRWVPGNHSRTPGPLSAIQQSTVLFKVPAAALMNKKTIAKLYPQLRGRRLSGVQLVSLHLYLHKPHGEEDSRDPVFGPYISTLPRDFSSHPLTWLVKRDAREADTWENTVLSLLPLSAFRKLSALRDRFRTDWKTVGRVLVRTLLHVHRAAN